MRNSTGAELTPDALKRFLDGKIAKWWIPDDVQFVDEIPHGATGKINKVGLRDMFEDYQFPTLSARVDKRMKLRVICLPRRLGQLSTLLRQGRLSAGSARA